MLSAIIHRTLTTNPSQEKASDLRGGNRRASKRFLISGVMQSRGVALRDAFFVFPRLSLGE